MRKTHSRHSPIKARPVLGRNTLLPPNGHEENAANDPAEQQFLALAMTNKLARSATNAIRRQRAKGLPITFQRGNLVIKQYPDGHEEVLTQLPTPTYRIPKGVAIIGSK